ncbi:hypothetical protein [Elizabethkingia meningoseptica]|uniref:hypothetical protein n=1 Tax=Elizabethkingia meningoseptica TaxID=238 RepID=UPI0008419B2D|nr:hypothetical protein [Elizabethkingia meningoseptica]ODM52740.1 hypothetical protein BES09_14020 [Elizabethkingia meningoseptica]OHT27650.1 hypothetical protein BFF93_14025 [Elizabethkingia meningoseptica]OPC09074.1 hypothetical protein BAX93_12125 [Elizabethkingia meningoseptica]
MKKLLLGLLVATAVLNSCRKDDYYGQNYIPSVDQATQNTYDDTAIKDYLDTHYFDDRGKIKAFDDTNKPDDKNVKLSSLAKTLPSGTIYVIRPNAQPTNGTAVHDNDVIKIMQIGFASRAIKADDKIQFAATSSFFNTVDQGGIPKNDPQWFYVKQSAIDAEQKRLDTNNPNNTVKVTKSYFEMEGFQEAIKQFQSFTKNDVDDYNLQGLIIVPSRAAFGKDPHYNYTGISLNDFTFFFNFQLYGAKARTTSEQ